MGVKLGTDNNWAIKDGNLLAYNDASGRFFNKEFDFARGSRATYVGRDGLIKNSGEQPTNLVQNGDFSQLGSELVTNGDFSDGLNNWSVVGGSYASVNNGILNSNNTVNGSWASQYIGQNIAFVNGKTYKVKFSAKNVSGNLTLRITQGANVIYSNNLTNEFTEYVIYYTANANNGSIRLFCNDQIGEFEIDNVSVKQVDPNDEWSLGAGWSIGEDKAVSVGSNVDAYLSQSGLVAGKTYKVAFDILDYVSGTLSVRAANEAQAFLANSNGSYVGYVTSISSISIGFRSAGSGFIGSVTNISVQEIDTNTPRIDFTDDVNGHLLLEPQRTNLITYSEDFSNAFWLIQNSSITLNSTISPDGTLNAAKLTENTSNSTHRILNGAGLTVSGDVSISVFAKKGERNWIRLTNNNIQGAFFDLDNGVVGDVIVGIDAKIENYGNGWYRCSISQTGVANERLGVYTSIDGVNTTYTGDGTSGVYIYGAQLEVGSYPTSYIPTYGSVQTRLGESCNNSGSAQDFNSAEGVLYAEISGFENDLSNRRISLSDGTANNSIRIFYYNDGGTVFFRKYVGGVQTSIATIGSINQHELTKIAIKYNSTNFDIFANGVKISTNLDSNSFPTNTLNKIGFADGSGSGTPFYGNVKEVKVYNTALTDAELIALTT
jgi:hypothetical protein